VEVGRSWSKAGQSKSARPYPKRKKKKTKAQRGGGVAPVVKCLPSKHKALNLNPRIVRKKKKFRTWALFR
jgi:hypothetical protein